MFFSSPAHFLWHLYPFRKFAINSFSLPWQISFAGQTPVWVNAGLRRICGSWNLIKQMLETYKCLRAKTIELQFLYIICWLGFLLFVKFSKNWKKYLLNWQTTLNPIFCNAPLRMQDITEVDCHDALYEVSVITDI